MEKNEGLSFLGTNAKDEGLRSKKRRGFAIASVDKFFSSLNSQQKVGSKTLQKKPNRHDFLSFPCQDNN